MAEVVGLAASIIQIAGAGAKLSVTLYNFTSSAARADQDIKDIADDVELTSNALESVGKVFESEDAKSIISTKAVQDAHNIIKKCQGVFDELSEMVGKRRKTGKDGKKTLSMMGKLAWPMKEQRVELHRKRLESLKNSLVLLLHVLQLAQGQSRGKMEKSVMEEERDKIRELHQRQQDSIKSLQALESRFCGVAIDNEETLQGSSSASRVPTLELMTNAQTMKLPPLEKHIESPTNTVTIDISATDDSDTSDSDATMTGEDDEHISREELSKAAKHVTKLLRRIIVLQKSLENDQKPHQRRRVRKIYQRFCRKFESGINVTQAMGPSRYGSPATRSSNQYNHALDLGDMGGGALENFDFDSFLHVGSESPPFPVVPEQQQPMSPLPPRQHLNEPQPEDFQFDSNRALLKRKGSIPVQQSDTASDKSKEPIIEKPKRIGSWGRPKSPRVDMNLSNHSKEAEPRSSIGLSPAKGPRNVIKRCRERDAIGPGLAELMTQHGGPPMPMLAVPKMSSEAVSSCDARFQIPGFAVPGAYFSPVTSPAPNAQSHQYAHQQSQKTTSGTSTKEGSRFEACDGGGSPEDGSLMTISSRSTQKRKRSRSIVSDAVRQRNSHAQETPSIPDDMRTPVVRHPSDDKREQEADRPRDNKIRRIRSTLDVGLEGTYSTLLQKEKKRKQIFEIEEPFDPGDRDVVDVLLEQWTVPEH
ncbi:hypothetical protein B0T12DRAFT_45300 [Alternaria alternata]|nr:hypothetical protein B0T12DRAFT_45300 [Alternaria alternata]